MALRVLITDLDLGDPAFEVELLRSQLECDVTVADCHSEQDVLDAVRAVRPHAIIVQWAPITDAVLSAAPDTIVISRVGIGLDMIDLAAAAAHGVVVLNVPHYCTEEVATHAVAMGLSLWRRLPELDASLRAGEWDAASVAPSIKLLSASTVGLVGMGRIGRLVGDAFAHWGTRVIVADPVQGADPYPRASLEQIAAESDLISLHAPLVDETRQLIDGKFLDSTARSPILINVSRGGLIDQIAVDAALRSGVLSGAGLDVFEPEPLAADHPLRTSPHTILAPHAAWCSQAALPALRRGAVANVVSTLSETAARA
jgi:D-3-phosphoglycerate dehydrogenase / 2-oxoglutarate reductase